MTSKEFEERLAKIERKQDRILNLLTRCGKALHLLPVTEEEEQNIQLQQRSNLDKAAKVSAKLDDMQNVNTAEGVSLEMQMYKDAQDIYSDVVGTDFLGGFNNESK